MARPRLPKWSWVEKQWLAEDIALMSTSPEGAVPVIQRSQARDGHPTRYVVKPDGTRRFCTQLRHGY